MQLQHDVTRTHQVLDERHLVAAGGLVPLMGLAQRCGLAELVADRVEIASSARLQAKGEPGGEPGGQDHRVGSRDGCGGGLDRGHGAGPGRRHGLAARWGVPPSRLGSHLRA